MKKLIITNKKLMNINNKKKIIITGSNGYLGSKLSEYFSNLNYEILCIYNKKKNTIRKKNVTHLKLNLLKKIPINRINQKFDVILHFAGPKNHRSYINKNRNKKKILDGIKIDKNIINFCIKNKIKFFIYASSSSVYDLNEGIVKKKASFKEENVKINSSFDGTYGYTKKTTENYLTKLQSDSFNATICRIFSIYGNDTSTIINNWKKDINENKKIQIWGNDIIRSWLHIDDFLRAINYILNANKRFKIVNIGSKEITSLEKIVTIMQKKLKKKTSKVQIIHTKYPGPRVRYANQSKLKKLGWNQKISLSKGVGLI